MVLPLSVVLGVREVVPLPLCVGVTVEVGLGVGGGVPVFERESLPELVGVGEGVVEGVEVGVAERVGVTVPRPLLEKEEEVVGL